MGFASESGYTPLPIDQMMDLVMANVNTQFGTTYTTETFLGTNFYKYFYALMQRLQINEVKTSEIFLKLQEYFDISNEMLQRPNTTHPGIFDFMQEQGFFVSTKPPEDADAGKAFVCVNLTDNHARGTVEITNYANLVSGTDDEVEIGATTFTAQSTTVTPGDATFQASISNEATAQSLASQINTHAVAGAVVEAWNVGAIVYMRAIAPGTGGNSIALSYTDNDSNVGAVVSDATFLGGRALEEGEQDYDDIKPILAEHIKNCIVAGVVSQGTEITAITLTNGQSMDFKYFLPDRIPVLIRVTTVLSENNEFTILSPDDQKQIVFDNINARYKLGKNFEPQRYVSVVDFPWAATVLLEWSDDDGSNWYDDVFETEFDEVFIFELTDISIVEG